MAESFWHTAHLLRLAVLDHASGFSQIMHGRPVTASEHLTCSNSERSKLERVGTTIFPGLVKVTHGATPTAGGSAQPVGSRL